MKPIDDTAAVPEAPQPLPSRRRWPLGALTLIVVGAVVAGVLTFGGDAGSDPSIASPGLPGARGLPTLNGQAAPDFSLVLLDGTEFGLSDHLETDGRPVVLNLWASWCPPCRAEMPALDAASKVHTEVFFLGVAVEDDPGSAEAFATEIGVSYALAIDEADRVSRRYQTPGLPATYFISTDGNIARTIFGQINEDQIDQLIAETFGL